MQVVHEGGELVYSISWEIGNWKRYLGKIPFLNALGELYLLEAEYEKGKLSAVWIKACRQNLKTKDIIIKIRSKLDAMLIRQEWPDGEGSEKP